MHSVQNYKGQTPTARQATLGVSGQNILFKASSAPYLEIGTVNQMHEGEAAEKPLSPRRDGTWRHLLPV